MKLLYIIYTIFLAIVVEAFSLVQAVLFWWFLLLKKFKRFNLFFYIIAKPWIFLVVRLLLFTRIKVIGRENVHTKTATLYICNHQSWLDVPILINYTKSVGISKKEVKYLPILGILITYAGPVFVDRVNQSSRISILKEITQALKGGHSLTLYPEGTRSRDGKILKANNAVIKMCYKLNIPVVPAAIEGTQDILPRGRVYFKPFQKVALKFNKPANPKDFKNEEDFANHCWQSVLDSHREITKKFFPERYKAIYENSTN